MRGQGTDDGGQTTDDGGQTTKAASTKCDCLKIITTKLTETHGPDSNVELELQQMLDGELLNLYSDLPPLRYSYKTGKKRKKSYVAFNFCPFCGKRKQ